MNNKYTKNVNVVFLPPWLKYPDVDRLSLFWRMGKGEDYLSKWYEWYKECPEKTQYMMKFPEPIAWKGSYKSMEG